MSTIASPREPSTPLRRVPSSTASSARPSLEGLRSSVTSPVNNGPPSISKRSNRAALREYYNLRARAPRIELPDSEVESSDLDARDFNADEYVNKVVGESSLEDLLRLYTRVVGEVRALDAEKKALVYDNYSKLISATETIRKMRSNMDPLNPMASTLNPAITQIYNQANSIRETLRSSVPAPDSEEGRKLEAQSREQKAREVVTRVLATPQRLRQLVEDGKFNEAKSQWEMPRRLLESWKEKGIGGDDVQECLDAGDAIINPPGSRSSQDV
ncbi:hypothetical protein Golomagni_07434 [Golovinomyces magnicellulatus]|nr:hypothetical protein Golomagni_07434 [Golovinomyces magnicellulatus]